MTVLTTQGAECFEVLNLEHGLLQCAGFFLFLSPAQPSTRFLSSSTLLDWVHCLFSCPHPTPNPSSKVFTGGLRLITSRQCLFATEAAAGSLPTKRCAVTRRGGGEERTTLRHASPRPGGRCHRVSQLPARRGALSHVRTAHSDTFGPFPTQFSPGDHEIIES